jgi:AraC-like DNA-binding protein
MRNLLEISALCFLAIVLVSFPATLKADTLAETNPQQAAVDSGGVATLKTDTAPAQPNKLQPTQPKSVTKSRRDSALRALLSTLEKEDSLNALSGHDSAAALQGKKTSKLKINGSLIQQIVRIVRQHPRPFVVAGVIAFILLLWLIALRIAGKKIEKRFMTTTRLSLMDGEVRRACVHIEKHFSEPTLTPVSVCAAIVTGEPFLEALFQKELGMNIAGYIAQTRIHHAKHLIKENSAAEAQSVAVKSGFPDVAAFNTLFEKLTGYTFEDFPKEQ